MDLGEDVIDLPTAVMEDLSTDQEHAYILFKAVTSLNISFDHAALQCGTMDHSRWLTTANRVMKLWMSEHGLQDEDLGNLKAVLEWLVGCYYPMWFQIKSHHHWL